MKLKSFLSAGLLLATATASQAAVTVTLPTVSTAGSLVIDAPIQFDITTSGFFFMVFLDEWVTSDGSPTQLAFTNGSSLAYKVNGGATQFSALSSFRDNMTATAGSFTPNDGVFFTTAFPVTAGDSVTLLPASYALAAANPSGFNPASAQVFTGNLFVGDFQGIAISGLAAAVPEPSAALLSLAAAGLLMTRRRVKGA